MKRLLYYISTALPLRFRMLFLKWSGVTVGRDAVLSRGFYIDRSNGLCLGQKVFVNYGVHFHCGADEKCRIEIQDKVFVGPDVKFCIPSHNIGKASQRAGANTYESICVKQGAWVCAASIILGGVTIGEGSIVAAGSVVINDVPPNEMWGGVPARFIKHLDE